MDIQGFGARFIEQLQESGHLTSLLDIYTLEERHRQQLRHQEMGGDLSEELRPLHELPGRGLQSIGKLFVAIERSRSNITLARSVKCGRYNIILDDVLAPFYSSI